MLMITLLFVASNIPCLIIKLISELTKTSFSILATICPSKGTSSLFSTIVNLFCSWLILFSNSFEYWIWFCNSSLNCFWSNVYTSFISLFNFCELFNWSWSCEITFSESLNLGWRDVIWVSKDQCIRCMLRSNLLWYCNFVVIIEKKISTLSSKSWNSSWNCWISWGRRLITSENKYASRICLEYLVNCE